MENFDWLSTIKINIKMLKYISLWPDKGLYKFNLYSLCSLIIVLIFIHFYNLSIFIGIVLSRENLENLTARIFMSSSEILTSIKTHHLVKNVRMLNLLTEELKSEKFLPPKNTEQIKLIQPDLNVWKVICVLFQISCWVTVIFIISTPFFKGSYKEYELPHPAWFPYDTKVSPIYEITYCYQSLGLFAVVAAVLSLDVFVMNWMMIIGAQCDILCSNLRNIKNENDNFSGMLMGCIQHHKAILSLADNCNKCYEVIFLWQLSNSSLTLALTMFQLSLVAPASSDVVIILAYAAAAATQIFMYCWFGNQVELKSSQIPYSAFESDWTGIPIEAKKNLLIFIMRAQKPIKMSAINLFSLSLATFTTILRTSWSYFAVLRQVNTQE